jgi:hypothetical protein
LHTSYAQVSGGEHAFEFLRLSPSPHVSALGGMSVSSPTPDVMMSLANPALLRPAFHTTMGLNYNRYYAGTKVSNLFYAHHVNSLKTTFGMGLQYLNYGSITQTNDLGQVNGSAQAVDYHVNLSASRAYGERWRYGASLKFAHSSLINQRATALLSDLGVMYADTANQWYFGATLKNAGVMLKRYDPDTPQPLPSDLQIGVTKKFKKAPFSIMVLAHHLGQWDIRYDNPADQQDNLLLFTDTSDVKEKNYVADKFFRHLVFALDISLGKRIELSAGYNHMRRSELGLDEKKGMSGFSYGAGIYLNKFTIHIAQSHYHLAGAYTEVGLNIQLNRLLGLGTAGKGINWSEKFADSYR